MSVCLWVPSFICKVSRLNEISRCMKWTQSNEWIQTLGKPHTHTRFVGSVCLTCAKHVWAHWYTPVIYHFSQSDHPWLHNESRLAWSWSETVLKTANSQDLCKRTWNVFVRGFSPWCEGWHQPTVLSIGSFSSFLVVWCSAIQIGSFPFPCVCWQISRGFRFGVLTKKAAANTGLWVSLWTCVFQSLR